jgi:hypothetical protein
VRPFAQQLRTAATFARHRPYVTQFEIAGGLYGGGFNLTDDIV